MAKTYKPDDTFDLVCIRILVPHGEDTYKDLLSDSRDDNPESILEWDQLSIKENLSVKKAQDLLKQMDSDTEILIK